MSQEAEISDAMIHALDTALLAYLGRQNAVEVRDLVLNIATVRKAAWQMFAEGWLTMVAGKRAGLRRATSRTERRANRHRHRPIVERYLDMVARDAFDQSPTAGVTG
jgi:hypothetical protein